MMNWKPGTRSWLCRCLIEKCFEVYDAMHQELWVLIECWCTQSEEWNANETMMSTSFINFPITPKGIQYCMTLFVGINYHGSRTVPCLFCFLHFVIKMNTPFHLLCIITKPIQYAASPLGVSVVAICFLAVWKLVWWWVKFKILSFEVSKLI